MKSAPVFFALLAFFAAATFASCGTVVGNPKKPSPNPGTPPVSAIVYTLPAIDFAVPEEATSDDAALNLVAAEGPDALEKRGDKTPLKAWARRFDKLLKQVNNVGARINDLADEAKDSADAASFVHFSGKSRDGQLQGKIGPAAAGSGYDNEAVVCYSGQPYFHFKWTTDAKKIELTRDFAAVADAADAALALKTRIVVAKGDDGTLAIDMESSGQDADGFEVDRIDGPGLTERTQVTRLASGELRLKTTADRWKEEPAAGEFEGDLYLVARMRPGAAANASAGVALETAFVAYSKGLPEVCGGGFDENASDLWVPDFSGPHFCLGRPYASKRFLTRSQFKMTALSLKAIGILSKKDLETVTFSPETTCDSL